MLSVLQILRTIGFIGSLIVSVYSSEIFATTHITYVKEKREGKDTKALRVILFTFGAIVLHCAIEFFIYWLLLRGYSVPELHNVKNIISLVVFWLTINGFNQLKKGAQDGNN